MENVTEKVEENANGGEGSLIEVSVEKESPAKAEKPWIAAGFKSRDEWRKSKGQKTAKTAGSKTEKLEAEPKAETAAEEPVKEKAAKKAKKPPKAKAVKAAAKKPIKANKPAKKAPRGRTRREEPSDRQKQVLSAFGGIGKRKTIGDLEKAFPNKSKAKANSWVRNQMRWLLGTKFTKKIEPGVYERVK